jgi:hypothetical protein
LKDLLLLQADRLKAASGPWSSSSRLSLPCQHAVGPREAIILPLGRNAPHDASNMTKETKASWKEDPSRQIDHSFEGQEPTDTHDRRKR